MRFTVLTALRLIYKIKKKKKKKKKKSCEKKTKKNPEHYSPVRITPITGNICKKLLRNQFIST